MGAATKEGEPFGFALQRVKALEIHPHTIALLETHAAKIDGHLGDPLGDGDAGKQARGDLLRLIQSAAPAVGQEIKEALGKG